MKNFHKALSEIFPVSKSYAFLSLSDVSRAYRLYVQIPKIGEIKKIIPLPRFRRPVHKFDGEHNWEIGKTGYSSKGMVADVKKVGF